MLYSPVVSFFSSSFFMICTETGANHSLILAHFLRAPNQLGWVGRKKLFENDVRRDASSWRSRKFLAVAESQSFKRISAAFIRWGIVHHLPTAYIYIAAVCAMCFFNSFFSQFLFSLLSCILSVRQFTCVLRNLSLKLRIDKRDWLKTQKQNECIMEKTTATTTLCMSVRPDLQINIIVVVFIFTTRTHCLIIVGLYLTAHSSSDWIQENPKKRNN